MSAARKQGRFGYLSQQETPSVMPEADDTIEEVEKAESARPTEAGGVGGNTSAPHSQSSAEPSISTQTFSSVPKGHGRMKQERSQLNVRIPTHLKRQATAKAILDGRDIGEVIEELLRKYVER